MRRPLLKAFARTRRRGTQQQRPLHQGESREGPSMTTNLTFFCQEVDAAHRLLDLQTLLHFASLNIPETDGFVIRPADEALATK